MGARAGGRANAQAEGAPVRDRPVAVQRREPLPPVDALQPRRERVRSVRAERPSRLEGDAGRAAVPQGAVRRGDDSGGDASDNRYLASGVACWVHDAISAYRTTED